MKTLKFGLLLISLLVWSLTALSQARVQVIHNSADAAASVVDVWLDQTLLLDNFAFRTASPFVDAPAGQQFTIAIKGPDSQNPSDPLWSQNYTLEEGETYVLVADGIISASGYNPAPPFDIEVFPQGRESAGMTDQTDALVHHGSTDAPTVDIFEVGLGFGQLVDNISYTEFDGYLELATKDYILEVRDEAGINKIAAFSAPLQALGLKGKAIVIVASGFLEPASNSNGPAFGLWVAPASGGPMLELPPYDPKARVQVIHNSADAAAAVVDVWMNETLLIDNFEFRTATPFIDAPAGAEFTLSVTGPDSPNPVDPIWSDNFTLLADATYILVAEGIVSATGYNPAIPFGIAVFPQGREAASVSTKTDMLVHHGSTDAPVVDIYETGIGAGLLVDDLAYGEFAGYLELQTLDYIIEIRDATGTSLLAAYQAPLQTLGLEGQAITTVASGFLDPSSNSNGPAFGLWVAPASGGDLLELPVYAPTARVQVIHNSADAAAEVVDVWLNETLIIDNFAFRTASPFIDAPAGQEFTIAIKGPDSQDPGDPIWSETYTLTVDQTYILVAEGIVSASGYNPATPFGIAVYPQGREQANSSGLTDMLIHHGSTDAPVIDVVEVKLGIGTVADNLAYSQFAGYISLAPITYIFEVRDQNGATRLAAFEAPFGTLGFQGDAITVVASGFLDPGNNSNGPEFGLWVALASGGGLIRLQEYNPTARVQVIHNSADAAAAIVDVWLNNTLLLDNFAFRTATPFVDVPAEQLLVISIKGPNSLDPYNPLWSQSYNLARDNTYIMVAEGIVSASGYQPAIPFNLAVYPLGRETAGMTNRTDLLVHHGSTDAPTVDVVEVGQGAGSIINDLSYGEFTSYLELPVLNYILEIRDETGTITLGAYRAPLQLYGLGGEAITVLASGFLDPSGNSNGPAFGLWAAVANGGPLIELPVYAPAARVQIIHNSPDAAAAEVDIWLDDQLLIDNFSFRTASPFIFAPAIEPITISIKGPDSQGPEDPIWSKSFTFNEDATYILVADGIISPGGYNPATPFDVYVFAGGREMALNPSNTDVLVFHGATDAPTVDIVEILAGAGTLVDDIAYGQFEDYLELPTANYSIDVRDETGTTTVANFAAPLATLNLDGMAMVVLASGFLDPSVNSDGAEFGLLAILTNGTAIMLTNTTGIEESPVNQSTFNLYPNPVISELNVDFELQKDDKVSLEFVDLMGRILKKTDLGNIRAGQYSERIELAETPSGIYFINIRTSGAVTSKRIVVR